MRGHGSVSDLNKLLKMHRQMGDMMKKMGKMGKGGMLKQAMKGMFGKGGPCPADMAGMDPAWTPRRWKPPPRRWAAKGGLPGGSARNGRRHGPAFRSLRVWQKEMIVFPHPSLRTQRYVGVMSARPMVIAISGKATVAANENSRPTTPNDRLVTALRNVLQPPRQGGQYEFLPSFA